MLCLNVWSLRFLSYRKNKVKKEKGEKVKKINVLLFNYLVPATSVIFIENDIVWLTICYITKNV